MASLSKCSIAITLLSSAVALPCAGQQRTVQIVLEQKNGASARRKSPQHVFRDGDLIRFRIRPSFSGFLYVMDRSTSGAYLSLFPETPDQDNRITASLELNVPAGAGSWFRIDRPSGYDTVYFVVSASPLTGRSGRSPAPLPPPPSVNSAAPANLLPRCDDSLFRARGECEDSSAGPRALPHGEPVPPDILADSSMASRDIVIVQNPKSSVVTSGDTDSLPVVYEFRIAHR